MTKEKIKDIATRASKTFIQAFVSSLTIDSFFGVTDVDAIKKVGISVLVGAVAAGISAVWNTILDAVYKKIDEAIPTDENEESDIVFETQIEEDQTIIIDDTKEEV